MSKEQSIVPIERVARVESANTDKSTRKMITKLEKQLGIASLALASGNSMIDSRELRFVETQLETQEGSLNLALMSTEKYSIDLNKGTRVISGLSMFGASGLLIETETGELISLTDPESFKNIQPGTKAVQVVADPMLHIAEASGVLRLTKALNMLQDQAGLSIDEIVFHIAVPEYKLNMVTLLQMGVLSEQQVEDICELLEQRCQGLLQLVKNRLPDDFPITLKSPLRSLEKVLSPELTLDEAKAVLSKNEIFARLLELQQPVGLGALPVLSYQAAYFQEAQRAREQNQNMLAVEIAEEKPIFTNAKELSEKEGISLEMAVLLVWPKTATLTGLRGSTALYMHQPNGESPLQSLKTVVAHSKGKVV